MARKDLGERVGATPTFVSDWQLSEPAGPEQNPALVETTLAMYVDAAGEVQQWMMPSAQMRAHVETYAAEVKAKLAREAAATPNRTPKNGRRPMPTGAFGGNGGRGRTQGGAVASAGAGGRGRDSGPANEPPDVGRQLRLAGLAAVAGVGASLLLWLAGM